MQKSVLLAIESSCDETSVALLQKDHTILSHHISSQIKDHRPFGGVVPEIASRKHTEMIHPLLLRCFEEAGIGFEDLMGCAVTMGPGLEGALLIGLTAAKTIAQAKQIPLVGVNHLHGHIYANFFLDPPPTFPFICLIVSGGHTQLVYCKDHFDFKIIGKTKDDAAGEAFDKVSRHLELGYPGGPVIEQKAKDGNPKAFHFPRPLHKQGLDFSFSGLKTAVIQQPKPFSSEDVCASFQAAVIDSLLKKSLAACEAYEVTHLCLSGGVVANKALRHAFKSACQEKRLSLFVPEAVYCTDNAAMIGLAGLYQLDHLGPSDPDAVMASPSLRL